MHIVLLLACAFPFRRGFGGKEGFWVTKGWMLNYELNILFWCLAIPSWVVIKGSLFNHLSPNFFLCEIGIPGGKKGELKWLLEGVVVSRPL